VGLAIYAAPRRSWTICLIALIPCRIHVCSCPTNGSASYKRGDVWLCVEGWLFVHQAQRNAWDESWFVNFCKTGPVWLVDGFTKLLAGLAFNRFVLWCVPSFILHFCAMRLRRPSAAHECGPCRMQPPQHHMFNTGVETCWWRGKDWERSAARTRTRLELVTQDLQAASASTMFEKGGGPHKLPDTRAWLKNESEHGHCLHVYRQECTAII
jgi:hypothetical protein